MTENTEEQLLGHFDRRESLEHLLQSYEAPKPEAATLEEYLAWDNARRAEFDERRYGRLAEGAVVGTPELQTLRKEVRRASVFANRAVGRTGVICTGLPTMGKTTAAFYAMLDAFQRHVQRYPDWKQDGHVPVVYIEVSAGSTAKAVMGRILNFLGVDCPDKMTMEERSQVVSAQLTKARTSLFVIDEMQNLARLNTGHFESAQSIKNLLNGIRAVPLYVGINLHESSLMNGALGEQFAARSVLVKFDRLGYDTPEERRLWGQVLRAFEAQLGLLAQKPKDIMALDDYLWHRTQGSIGALSRLLTSAALDLIDAGKPAQERITKELLAGITLDLVTEREVGNVTAPRKVGAKKSVKKGQPVGV